MARAERPTPMVVTPSRDDYLEFLKSEYDATQKMCIKLAGFLGTFGDQAAGSSATFFSSESRKPRKQQRQENPHDARIGCYHDADDHSDEAGRHRNAHLHRRSVSLEVSE